MKLFVFQFSQFVILKNLSGFDLALSGVKGLKKFVMGFSSYFFLVVFLSY